MDALIGLDVGSTTTSGGLVTPAGEVLETVQALTHRDGPGTALDTILGLVGHLLDRASERRLRLGGIGAGLPGIVDRAAGTMRPGIHRIPELTGAPIVEQIQAKSGLPAFIDNDVNALALAEWTFGVGRGARSLAMLALGTGVGGALILDGRLVRGHRGYAGEFGHVTIDLDGPRCVCGIRGCLSAFTAGFGIAATRAGEEPVVRARSAATAAVSDAASVFRAADQGDHAARAVVDAACRALGAGIGGLVNGLNPEAIVVTGGVVKSLARLQDRILAHVAEYAIAAALEGTRIHFVPGHKTETVRGGAALVLYERAVGPVAADARAPEA